MRNDEFIVQAITESGETTVTGPRQSGVTVDTLMEVVGDKLDLIEYNKGVDTLTIVIDRGTPA